MECLPDVSRNEPRAEDIDELGGHNLGHSLIVELQPTTKTS